MLLTRFVETTQYGRFKEFCNACVDHGYIGLCYGAPGVGKTRSARVYAQYDPPHRSAPDISIDDVVRRSVFYTVPVHNTPLQIGREIKHERDRNRTSMPTFQAIETEMTARIHQAQRTQRMQMEEYAQVRDHTAYKDFAWSRPDEADLVQERRKRLQEHQDPTRLIIIDEADRLRVSSLEQIRDIFDRDGKIGVILIGMPGLEKRLARYPQLYSRIGFVHEYRPLQQAETRQLLLSLFGTDELIDEEGIAALLRSSGGNFRLIERLLAQVQRVLEINELTKITADVVNTARESLVIGIE